MPRRTLSLLALLLLVLSAQAAADRDDDDGRDDEKDDDEGDGGRHGQDGRKGKDRDRDDREQDERHRDGKGKRGWGERRALAEPPLDPSAAGRGGDAGHDAASPSRPSAGDAGLRILTTVLPGRIQFSFVASAVALDEATLAATLPDVGGEWRLSGPGASSCDLVGLALDCRFAGLAPGEVQLVQASAEVGRAPPWELVAEGRIHSERDAGVGNDFASSGIGIFLA